MIIKSTVRGNGAKLAEYLLQDKKNDRSDLLDLRGWAVDTLKNALVLSEEIALGKTQCAKPFYHVSFRLPSGETLTRGRSSSRVTSRHFDHGNGTLAFTSKLFRFG